MSQQAERLPELPMDAAQAPCSVSDEEVVRRVLEGDLASFELIMRRYNQRIFRVVRGMLGDDDEAEDVVQDAYVRAYEILSQFAGRSQFSTWLTRIAVYEANARRKKRRRMRLFDPRESEKSPMLPQPSSKDAHEEVSMQELGSILAQAVDALPADLRTVFTLRMVEELDTSETADCLQITAANVKIRLHRARELLRRRIDGRLGKEVRRLYQFDGERCDRIVNAVLIILVEKLQNHVRLDPHTRIAKRGDRPCSSLASSAESDW